MGNRHEGRGKGAIGYEASGSGLLGPTGVVERVNR